MSLETLFDLDGGLDHSIDQHVTSPARPAEPRARARTSDPGTSHEAAASVTIAALTASQELALAILERIGPARLEDVVAEARQREARLSDSRMRSAVAELVALGVVADTGERRPSSSGRPSPRAGRRPPGGPTVTELEHVPHPGGIVPLEVDFDDLMRKSAVLASSGLVRKPLQGKPEAVAAVALRGAELGVRMMTALDEIDVIEAKTYLSSQLCTSLVRAAGHMIELVEQSRDRVVMRGRRREGGAWQQVEWTRERAREAGLLDVWVEKWLRADGESKARPYRYTIGNDLGVFPDAAENAPAWARPLVADRSTWKRKDNWTKHPTEMLRARCARELCRVVFGDVLIGLDLSADEASDELDASVTIDDLEPAEGEVLEHRGASPAPAADADEEPVDAVVLEDLEPELEPEGVATPDVDDPAVETPIFRCSVGEPCGKCELCTSGELADAVADARGWTAEEWTAHLAAVGVAPAAALIKVRKTAEALGVEKPLTLDAIADDRLVRALLELEG